MPARDAAKNALLQSGMAISAHYQQVDAALEAIDRMRWPGH